MTDTMTRAEFIEYMEAFEGRLKVQFEDVRKDIRFSFEAVGALRETTDRGFADMRTDHNQQIGLLQTAVTHVRGRVERLEEARD